MNEVRIDTIDFSAFMEFPENGSLSDLTEEQRRVARQIDKAFREEGFLKLENFGLTENELSTTFGLCQQLFSKPRAEKIRALKGIDRESNTGYVPYGLESLNSRRSADRKEVRAASEPVFAPSTGDT